MFFSYCLNIFLKEIFQGQKYKMSVEEDGFVHKLVISNPTTNDMGKYTCDVNNIQTSAYLDVEGEFKACFKSFLFIFCKI